MAPVFVFLLIVFSNFFIVFFFFFACVHLQNSLLLKVETNFCSCTAENNQQIVFLLIIEFSCQLPKKKSTQNCRNKIAKKKKLMGKFKKSVEKLIPGNIISARAFLLFFFFFFLLYPLSFKINLYICKFRLNWL